MLVTANILRNMLTINNNLTIPLIIGEVIVVADTCFDVTFFDFGYFAFGDAIPHKKDCDQKDNLAYCGQDGAVNHSERWNEETCNNYGYRHYCQDNSDNQVFTFQKIIYC